MKKFYVYITDRSAPLEFGYSGHMRVYANIYEAPDKEAVKALLLADVDYLKAVRQKVTKNLPPEDRLITSIHELDEYWEKIWLTRHKCPECLNGFTKLDKMKYATGGTEGFCSRECQAAYRAKFEPAAADNWDSAHVYKVTHKPTGLFYIGVTRRWLMQRWWEHIKAESGSPFHVFIKEHDITEFTFEVLENFKPSEVDPYEREAHYIALYDAVNKGLNTASAHKVLVTQENES